MIHWSTIFVLCMICSHLLLTVPHSSAQWGLPLPIISIHLPLALVALILP